MTIIGLSLIWFAIFMWQQRQGDKHFNAMRKLALDSLHRCHELLVENLELRRRRASEGEEWKDAP